MLFNKTIIDQPLRSVVQAMSNPFHLFNPGTPPFSYLPHLPIFPPLPHLPYPLHTPFPIPTEPALFSSPPNPSYYNPLSIQQQNNYFPQFQHFQNQAQCRNPYLQKLLNSIPKAINKQHKTNKTPSKGHHQEVIQICDDSPTTKKEQFSKTKIKAKSKIKQKVKMKKNLKFYLNGNKQATQQPRVRSNGSAGELNELCWLRKTRVSGKIPKQLANEEYKAQNQSSERGNFKLGKQCKGRCRDSSFKLIKFSTVIPAIMRQQDISVWKDSAKENLEARKVSP